MEFRDLGLQYSFLRRDIDDAVQRVMKSGCFIGGQEVSSLEQQLADYVGTRHCITCGNGTDALLLALMAWGIGPGDAVIVPDFTFFSSGEVVSMLGAIPVFVDVDDATFNIDAEQIEPACAFARGKGLTPRAVVAVDLFGLPADYPRIREVCDRLDLLVLEDGAQGFGGSIGEKKACSFGDISTTSFFPAKPLGCYGDGGALFTDNDEWAELVRSFAVHGKGEMKYDNIRIGMNSRLDAMQAAILKVKFDSFVDRELLSVGRIASLYTEELEDCAESIGIVLPYVPRGYTSSWAQYTVQLPIACNRDVLQTCLKDQGIPTMVYYPKPMHEQKAFAGKALMSPLGCENATRLCSLALSFPMSPYLSKDDVVVVTSAIKTHLGCS